MFFRKKKSPSGEVLQLIESYRNEEGQPRQRVVVSLGNASIAVSARKSIAKAVEKRLYGRQEFFKDNYPESDQKWIDTIVRRVDREGRWQSFKQDAAGLETIDGVLAERVNHTQTSSLGPSLVGWEYFCKLGFPECLKKLGFNDFQIKACAVAVINRLVDPVSENSLESWLDSTSLPELFGREVKGKDRFYRVSEKLIANKEAVEEHLRRMHESLFSLDRTIYLYDLTNSHFEGSAHLNPKAKRGKNKQKRNDCPQIVVGMVFDRQGFALAHQVFEGNRADSKTLLEMIGELEADFCRQSESRMVIVDSGVATKDNLKLLQDHGLNYLVNDSRRGRGRYQQEFLDMEGSFMPVPGRKGKPEVMVKAVLESSGEMDKPDEKVILCRSGKRRKKEKAILAKAEERLLKDLQRLQTRLEKGRLKDPLKIQRAVGRIEARHPRVRRYYHIELALAKSASKNKPASPAKLTWTRNDQDFQASEELLGGYVLRTDRLSLDPHELWRLYITLTKAEAGFRALKSDLGLRPNRHHIENRVDGHVFITVLAYHLYRAIMFTMEQAGDNRSWQTIRRILQTHSYNTIILPTEKGQVHRIRKPGLPEQAQSAIYNTLGIEYKNLPKSISVTKSKINPIL